MTPKAKAEDLFDKFQWSFWSIGDYLHGEQEVKQMVLVCIEEIQNNITSDTKKPFKKKEYWDNVIKEIKKL